MQEKQGREEEKGGRGELEGSIYEYVYVCMYVYIYLPTNSVSVYRTLCRDIQMQTNTPYIKLGMFSPSDSKLTVPLVFIT